MFETQPVGRNNVAFCTNICCCSTAPKTWSRTPRRSSACKLGESTADGRIFLKHGRRVPRRLLRRADDDGRSRSYHENLDAREGRRASRRAEVEQAMAHVRHTARSALRRRNTTSSTRRCTSTSRGRYENYLQDRRLRARWRKILDEKIDAGRRHRHGQGSPACAAAAARASRPA